MDAESIETDRLTLVPLAVEHAGEMAEVLADPGLHEYIGGQPLSSQALRARYERLVAGSPDHEVSWLNWVIRSRETGRLVGTVQATVDPRGAEIAWVVSTPWQGQGIAREAARALVIWLESHAVGTIVAHVRPGHLASVAVATAAGFVPTDVVHDGEVQWRRSAG